MNRSLELFGMGLSLMLCLPATAGEIRSDHHCVLAAVRRALTQATSDLVASADSVSLEQGLSLDVDSQYSTKFQSYHPEKATYVVAIDAIAFGHDQSLKYEVAVEEAADGKSCAAVSAIRK